MNKIFRYFLTALFCVGLLHSALAADIPMAEDIIAQLEMAKKEKADSADAKALVQNLEDTLTWLSQIEQQKQQKQQNDQLVTAISQAAKLTDEAQNQATKLKNAPPQNVDFSIVPNKAFVTERLINWSLTNSVTRLTIAIGVAYGSDLELTKKLLLQAAAESPLVLKEPSPAVYFLTFGASTLNHKLRVHVGHINDRTVTIDFLNRRINELFAENNIDIAFNQLDVFIKNPATGDEVKIVEEKQSLMA